MLPCLNKGSSSNLLLMVACSNRFWCGSLVGDGAETCLEHKLMKELTNDKISPKVIQDELNKFEDGHLIKNPSTHRERLEHFLHLQVTETLLMFLIFVDMLVILTMVILDMYIAGEEVHQREFYGQLILDFVGTACSNGSIPSTVLNADSLQQAMAAIETIQQASKYGQGMDGLSDHHVEHSRTRRAASGGPVLDVDRSMTKYQLQKAQTVLHFASVTILFILVVEVFLKISALGSRYFKKGMQVFDGVIVILSFIIDILFTDNQLAKEVGKSLVIMFLIWRTVRIMNAMMLAARAKNAFRMRVLRRTKELTDQMLSDSRKNEAILQTHVQTLIKVARDFGAPEELILPPNINKDLTGGMDGIRRMTASLMILNGLGPRPRSRAETFENDCASRSLGADLRTPRPRQDSDCSDVSQSDDALASRRSSAVIASRSAASGEAVEVPRRLTKCLSLTGIRSDQIEAAGSEHPGKRAETLIELKMALKSMNNHQQTICRKEANGTVATQVSAHKEVAGDARKTEDAGKAAGAVKVEDAGKAEDARNTDDAEEVDRTDGSKAVPAEVVAAPKPLDVSSVPQSPKATVKDVKVGHVVAESPRGIPLVVITDTTKKTKKRKKSEKRLGEQIPNGDTRADMVNKDTCRTSAHRDTVVVENETVLHGKACMDQSKDSVPIVKVPVCLENGHPQDGEPVPTILINGIDTNVLPAYAKI